MHYTAVFIYVNKYQDLEVFFIQSFFKIYLQLWSDLAPVLPAADSVLRDIYSSQMHHFQETVICRKYRLAFYHFPELTIEAFYDIAGVYQFADRRRIFEICR